MSDVELAECKSRTRATLFYLMAVTLVVSAWLGIGKPADGHRVAVWLVMVLLIALNLTPISTMFRRARWARLLDDDTAREHRRTAFEAGFWSTIAAAIVLAVVVPRAPITGLDVARVVITAGLAAALISFATLELRAARG